MDILNNAYQKCVTENEKNLRFWEEYVNSLKSLDFSVFSDKLTVPALVPIGNRIFFRGQLKHTNEVTVSLGADYFVKCSLKQAEVLRQHRIKDAQSKLEIYQKEKEYLQHQLSFSKENVYENLGKEIVEVCTDEEDRVWREKHRENMRQYKLKSKIESETITAEVNDEELWNRLEELELQEEIQNELSNINDTSLDLKKSTVNTFVVMEPDVLPPPKVDNNKNVPEINSNETKPIQDTSKMELLQQVLEKQNKLEQKLNEMRYKDRSQTKTEEDLISKLDEMEQLDELEDEMDRLEDILQTEDVESTDDEDSSSRQSSISKRGVTFADEDDSETIEIFYKHSSVEPSTEPYDPKQGITKPSDIYEAYSNLFTETTSILKKTKYEDNKNIIVEKLKEKNIKNANSDLEPDGTVINKTIVVKDVVEKADVNYNKLENTECRPTSLFKKKRLQKK